jgi:CNT family concentrative nucleoside transporter
MSPAIENLLRGAFGMFFLIFVCWVFSNNRKAINWRLVIYCLVTMIAFYLGVTKVFFINGFFDFLSRGFVRIINTSVESTRRIMFSNLIDADGTPWGLFLL